MSAKKSTSKVLMFVENTYPNDSRVRKEATALTKAGYLVTIIALLSPDQKFTQVVDGVRVYRIPELSIFKKSKSNKSWLISKFYDELKSSIGYILEYIYFTTTTLVVSIYILMRRRFDIVHMHNPPDTLAIIGIIYKILGKKYIFDHHDLSPELYLTRVSEKKDFFYNALIFFEKLSCKFSDIIITTNESFKQIVINRYSISPEKIVIVRNNPMASECISKKNNEVSISANDNKKVLLFIGNINPQDGVDVLLHALYHLVYDLGEKNFVCNIVGDGDSLESAKQIAAELKLELFIDFKGWIFDCKEIKKHLCLSDIGVEPAPYNYANENSTFIKIMEFMASGKPIVAFDLKETRYSLSDAGILVPPGDIKGFARAIKKLIDEPSLREALGRKGFTRITQELSFEKAAQNLLKAYKSLGI